MVGLVRLLYFFGVDSDLVSARLRWSLQPLNQLLTSPNLQFYFTLFKVLFIRKEYYRNNNINNKIFY